MRVRCVPRKLVGVKAVALEMNARDEHAAAAGYSRHFCLNHQATMAGPITTEQGRAWLVSWPGGELRFTTERVE